MSHGRWFGLLGVAVLACTPPLSGSPCNDASECSDDEICLRGFCAAGDTPPDPTFDAGREPKIVDAGPLLDDAGIGTFDAGPEGTPWFDRRWGARVLVEVTEPDFVAGSPAIDIAVPVRLSGLLGRTGDLRTELRATSDDGVSELPFELESVLAAPPSADAGPPPGEEVVWVRARFVSGTARFYIYIDNPDASPVNRAGAVWDETFTGVYHLENGRSSAAPFDLGEETNVDRPAEPLVGTSVGLDGDEDYLLFRNMTGAAASSGATLCAWINQRTANANAGLVNFSTADDEFSRFGLEFLNGALRTLVRPTDGQSTNVSSAATLELNRWYHTCAVVDLTAGRLELYLDGELTASVDDVPVTTSFPASPSQVAAIGADDDGREAYFDGIMDEVQISNVARSARHIRLSRAVQLGTTTTFVGEETRPRIAIGNLAPVANDDTGGVDEDNITFLSILANDVDADGDALSVVSVSGADRSTAFVVADNSIYFEPAPNFFGQETLTCEISDGYGEVTTQSLVVSVASVNDRPSVNNVFLEVDANATREFSLQISDPDDDVFTFTILDDPLGEVTALDGRFRYRAPATAADDDFRILVRDDDAAGDVANIFVNVIALPVDAGP